MRARIRWEPPDSRLIDQPVLRRAANTLLALAALHWLIRPRKRPLRVLAASRHAPGGRPAPAEPEPPLVRSPRDGQRHTPARLESAGFPQSNVHRIRVRSLRPDSWMENTRNSNNTQPPDQAPRAKLPRLGREKRPQSFDDSRAPPGRRYLSHRGVRWFGPPSSPAPPPDTKLIK